MSIGDRAESLYWLDELGPSGVEEQGEGASGLLRNVGDPARSTELFPDGVTG